MTHDGVFIGNKRKYLFCADQQGMKLLSDVMEQASEKEIFRFEDERDWTEFTSFLEKQKIGTYLYVSLPPNDLSQARKLSEDAGFSEGDAQFIGYGEKVVRVFCCRCHGINKKVDKQLEIFCQHCGLELSISDHYSKTHDAYLGYVAKL
ncbi:dimethylamine monooxygenase subunit DmmA family protein [Bacillus sp. NEB1478]|uniref:dimethylamine monooxygenase subunit DmmA family protein n=1 Tax=Bacillus sp. NEB1478 TaxID=3073816 RepID=UPI002873C47E|nr:dimethylamine monooxygenase subunit DmmA family protein [Bacillus sp. NEB1478]WNB91714.1 dimethylamine monooxygenase subunit DmmA family protein [Bacillus sp. NEB1478]